MKNIWKVLLFAVVLSLAVCVAFAEEAAETPEEFTSGGFTARMMEENDCLITNADESEVRDGVLSIPMELDGKNVIGFLPQAVSESVRLVVCHEQRSVWCDEDTAPDATVRFNAILYSDFRSLSADQLDRLPDMKKGEYALTNYVRFTVSRNGSIERSSQGAGYLFEDELPQELFGQKAYNLIREDRIARTAGDWTYTVQEEGAFIRRYNGAPSKILILPDKLDGIFTRGYNIDIIPAGTEYLFCPSDCWLDGGQAENQFTFIMFCYTTHERAQRYRDYLFSEVKGFTEDTVVIDEFSEMTWNSDGLSGRSVEKFIAAEDLPTEIDGKAINFHRANNYIVRTQGCWKYVIRDSSDASLVITGYTGEAAESFVVPASLDGITVSHISYAAIPETANTIYLQNGCWISTDNRYGPYPDKSRTFMVIRAWTYEYAIKENDSSLLQKSKSFTEGTCAIREIEQYKYSPSDKSFSSDSYSIFFPHDNLLTELDGSPLISETANERLSFRDSDYEYTVDYEGNVFYLSGSKDQDGDMLRIPSVIAGKEIRGFYMSRIPDDINQLFVPNNTWNRDSSKLAHEMKVYSYVDYEMISRMENTYENYSAVRPGEMMITSASLYSTTGSSNSLVQEYYEYPVSFNGNTIHNSVYNSSIAQHTSGSYTYYMLSDSKICICAYADNDARKVEIPAQIDGLTVVGINSLSHSQVFNTSKATEFILPDTLRILGNYALYSSEKKCKTLKLPAGLREIGKNAITLYYLNTLVLPEHLECIGSNAFSSTNIDKLIIPDSVTRIDAAAFRSMSRLASLQLPAGLTYIAEELCKDCRQLVSITIPAGVTEIGKNAFSGCKKLGKVTFAGDHLDRIGDSAFADCAAIRKMELPEGMSEIGYQVFYGCSTIPSFIVPSSVTKIGENAFGGCKALARVEIGSNVTEIASNAFEGGVKKMTFVAPEGSYAAAWAAEKGHTVKVPK